MILVLSLGWTQQIYTIIVMWIAGCGILYLLRVFNLLNPNFAYTGRRALTVGCLAGVVVLWYSFRPPAETPRIAIFPFQAASGTSTSDGYGVALSQTAVDLLRLSMPSDARVIPFDMVDWEVQLADTINRASVINASIRLGSRYAVFGSYYNEGDQLHLRTRFLDILDTTEVINELVTPIEKLSESPVRLVEAVGRQYDRFAPSDTLINLLDHAPHSGAFAEYCRGLDLASTGTFEGYWEASEAFRTAITLDSSYALPHYGMAQVQAGAQRPGPKYQAQNASLRHRAIDQAKVAVILNPRLSESYRFMAESYMRLRQWDNMSTVLKQAIAADPLEPINYVRISLTTPDRFADVGFEDEAAICEQAVVLNNDSVLLWQKLMDGYISAGRLKDALRFGRDILEQKPDQVEVLAAAGTAFRYNNRAFDAVEVYQKAVKMEPYNPDYYYYLSEAYAMRQNHDDIVKTFEEGIARMPDSSELHYYMGVSYQKIGKWADAVPWFEKAIELDDHLNSHYYMARWFEKQGNRTMAVHHWTRRVTLGDPSDQWTKEATRRLRNLSPSALPSLKSIGASS